MKILVVCGSPHLNGTTNRMADTFIASVDPAKHEVEKVQLSGKNIAPCKACEYCKSHDGNCIAKDDMEALYPSILGADLIVFVTPLYYFGFSAQLKTFIDRFYAVNAKLREQTEKKAILLTAGAGAEEWIMNGLLENYRVMLRYLHWESLAEIYPIKCRTKEDLEGSIYLEEIKKLGAGL